MSNDKNQMMATTDRNM